MIKLMVIMSLFIVFSFSVNAGIYHCKDSANKSYFSDKPCEVQGKTGKEVKIKVQPSKTYDSNAQNRQQRMQQMLQSLQESRANREEAKAKKAEKDKKCAYLYKRLEHQRKDVNSGGRLYQYDDNGDRQYISHEQASNEVNALEKKIKQYCQ